MKIHQKQIICVEDWTRRPPRGQHPQGFTYTLSQTHPHSYTSLTRTRTHTGQFSLTSIPSQANTIFSSLLVSQFHLTNFHPNLPQPITSSHYRIHPKKHPRSLLTPTTISLPSPRLSLIHSLHHLDLHLLTTNITHITQKSTNTTQQQHTVML